MPTCWAIKFCSVAHNICVEVASCPLLVPRILRCLLDLWKTYVPMHVSLHGDLAIICFGITVFSMKNCRTTLSVELFAVIRTEHFLK